MTDYEAAFRNLTDKWHESVKHYEARIEKLEAALIDILKVPRSEASWGIALVIAHHALKEGKDE